MTTVSTAWTQKLSRRFQMTNLVFCKEYTIQLLSQKRTAGETELKLNLFSYFQSSSLLVNVMLQNLKFSLILYQNTSLSFSLCYFKFLMPHVTTFFILLLLSF